MPTSDRTVPGVDVRGADGLRVADVSTARERFGWEDREFTIRCHSGRVTRGRWGGIPLAPVLEAAGCGPDTTHLLVTARDGFQVCVPIEAALDGLIGLDRESVEVTPGDKGKTESPDGTPRLLGSRIDDTKTVRDLDAIEPVSVPPGADPIEHATED
jgi:hypothetical protein